MKIAADTQHTHTQADMRNIFVDLVQGHESSRTWGGVSFRPTQSLDTNRTQELRGTSVLEQIFFACLFVLVFSLSNSNSRGRGCDEGPVVGLAQWSVWGHLHGLNVLRCFNFPGFSA